MEARELNPRASALRLARALLAEIRHVVEWAAAGADARCDEAGLWRLEQELDAVTAAEDGCEQYADDQDAPINLEPLRGWLRALRRENPRAPKWPPPAREAPFPAEDVDPRAAARHVWIKVLQGEGKRPHIATDGSGAVQPPQPVVAKKVHPSFEGWSIAELRRHFAAVLAYSTEEEVVALTYWFAALPPRTLPPLPAADDDSED